MVTQKGWLGVQADEVFAIGLLEISEYVCPYRIQTGEVMPQKISKALLVALIPLAAADFSNGRAATPEKLDFNHHIKPLLSDRCFACHGPDEKSRKGKLRLDTKDGAFKALDGGMFVIKPSDAAHSELVRRITSTDPDEMMPPPKSNLALSKHEVELFKRWVQQGAEWKKHWSFIPVEDVKVPSVKNKKWPRNDIDRFVLARLEKEGLRPSKEAPREPRLRRV